MKCEECKNKCEKSICFSEQPTSGHQGWVVYCCTNRGCSLGAHNVPQVPGRKAVDMMEVLSAKPSLVRK